MLDSPLTRQNELDLSYVTSRWPSQQGQGEEYKRESNILTLTFWFKTKAYQAESNKNQRDNAK